MRLVPDIKKARELCKEASTKGMVWSIDFNNGTFMLVRAVITGGRVKRMICCQDRCRGTFRAKFLAFIEKAKEFQYGEDI